MDNTNYGNEANPIIGIPYENINWEDIPGQPFGKASQFNLFVLGDANNIVDVEGAMAVGGSFYSPRSLSIGFERKKGQVPIEFAPDAVRYLVGNIVSMKGPLVVIGHAVAGGSFKASPGSTYYIGKDNARDQAQELNYLYHANGGSRYWTPTEHENYYIISSYDVPRVIPASRISANLTNFFQNARRSLINYQDCIKRLDTNGTISSNSYEWILTGTNPKQNVFTLDVRPNGLINKGIRFDIPEGSVAIVRLRTGPHAHLQYGLYGSERLADHILYEFEDATNIHMEKSSDIWGSILAPQAMFHGHPTGGRVSGNAALGGFAVNANSGFEFHLYPFVGGVTCMESTPVEVAPIVSTPIETPTPVAEISPEVINLPVVPPCPTCPEAVPCPQAPPCPQVAPCPIAPPCPTCPEAVICPEVTPCPVCPEQTPCPTCPEERPCPVCPTCPEQQPCPVCPTCPEQQPCPTCPICPECPEYSQEKIIYEKETEYIAVPFPVPVIEKPNVPICEKCLIKPGIIAGSVFACDCCRNHEWDIMLYQIEDGERRLIYCITISHLGCFKFEVDYDASYILKICPTRRNCFSPMCKPKIAFQNIGVANFTIE